MTLTIERKEQYLKSMGIYCPFCGSDDISAGPLDADYGQAWSNVECQNCKRVWKDIYTLSDIEEVAQ
jgi:transcription elongation factor Elf1